MNSMRMFGGLTLLALGGVFVAINQGALDSSIWLNIFSLWPVLLVVLGLKLLIRNDKLLAILTLFVFLFSILFVAITYDEDTIVYKGRQEVSTGSYNVESVKKLDLSLNTGAVRLKLGVLPEGTASGVLYQIHSSNMGKISVVQTISGDTVSLNLEEKSLNLPMGPQMMASRDLELLLPADLILKLNLDIGASKLDLDFSSLKTEKVTLSIGASSGDIYLGRETTRQSFELQSGASNLVFYVPKEVGVTLAVAGGLNNIQSDSDLSIEKNGDTYSTSNFETYETQVSITASTGATNINLKRK